MFLVEIIVAVAIIFADLILKNLAATVIASTPTGSVDIISGFFSLTYTENKGAAWSIFSNYTWILTVISLLASVAFIVFLFRTKNKHKLMRISIVLITAGAIGNLYDRAFLGYVRDMLRFDFINFPVFNLADSSMVIGVIILIVYIIFIYKEPPENKVVETASVDENQQQDKTDDKN